MQGSASVRLPAVPALRIFRGGPEEPDDGDRELSSGMSVSQFFARYFRPVRLQAGRAKPATIAEYRTAIERWAQLTGDPPLSTIDGLTLAGFVEADLGLTGRTSTLSPNTVRKHCIHLENVLRAAGPRTRDCKWAASEYGYYGTDEFGRVRSAPWFHLPTARDKPPIDSFTLDEIRRLIVACDHATLPRLPEIRPSEWWRRLIRFAYNAGMRIGTILALRRQWLRQADGAAWFEVPGSSYKGGRSHLLYVSPVALDIVLGMPERDILWRWPHTLKTLHRQRVRILEAAGIPEERQFGFHGLRKALGTALYRRNPEAARLALGHQDQATTREHYAHPDVVGPSMAAVIGPSIADLPQP